MFSKVTSFIQKHSLIKSGNTIILGLSGGPDSVFLLHFLTKMHQKGDLKLIAAHLNHEWRPNAQEDAVFCQKLCQKLRIPLVTAKLSELPFSAQKNGSKEAYARTMRRKFFMMVKKEHSANIIALGHHADDQQETFFIRLIRGASLTGLAAMQPKHGDYIRPLLGISKAEIITYLNEHSLTYITDETNISQDYLRNRIRQSVIPALIACDTRASGNLLKTITRLQEDELLLKEITAQTFIALLKPDDHTWINVKHMITLPPALKNRVLMHWLIEAQVPFTPQERFLQEIMRFLHKSDSKKHTLHESWHIVIDQEWASIIKNPLPLDQTYAV